jgi:Flp pilus assembly pilin Flp
MVEYALLVGLIAIVAVVALLALGPAIANLFKSSSNCVVGLSSSTCP